MAEFKPTRSASLRGFAFHLDTGNESGGHRKIDHAYPNRDPHYIEDLGLNADQFQIRGYISNLDRQGDQIRRLRQALKSKGVASFYHPLLDEMFQVEVLDWTIDSSKERIGRVDFGFSCIKINPSRDNIAPLLVVSGQARLTEVAQTLRETLLAYLAPVLNAATISSDAQAIFALMDEQQSFVFEPGRQQYQAVLSEMIRTTDEADVVDHFMELAEALYADTLSSGKAFRVFSRLVDAVLDAVPGVSAPRVAQNAQRAGLSTALNVIAFKTLADVVVNHEYQDAQSAHDLRFRFARIGLELRSRYSVDAQDSVLHDAVAEIIALVGQEYQALTDGLRPVAELESFEPLSSLAVAWNIYQDPRQAEDLVLRNGAFTAGLNQFEYLVPESREYQDYAGLRSR